MSDPLDPLIPPPSGKLPNILPTKTDDLEALIYGIGASAFVLGQLGSKSNPHLAGKLSENILGPEIVAAELKFVLKPGPLSLSVAPPPFGFVSPRRFGLEPNYLYALESRLKSYGMGLEKLTPPPTHFLHNLPDTDPRVAIERLEYEARAQQLVVRQHGQTRSVDELFDLYALARDPNATKVFVNPKEIEEELQSQLTMRLHGDVGFRTKKVEREIALAALNLPAPETMPTTIPSPFGTHNPSLSTNLSHFGETPDLFAFLERSGVNRPRLGPPTLNAQQEANDRAPPLLRELASERADP